MGTPISFILPLLAGVLLLGGATVRAQYDVTARVIDSAAERHHGQVARAALFWLEPVSPAAPPNLTWTPQSKYRLLQKNKMFSPHLLVVPAGAIVTFPNADPFFHNVFSLFDGKRFDLGLYEAGRSRDVHFDRQGISYIFCNIHPEMGAVIITLDTQLWATPQTNGDIRITSVPDGTYEAHLWLEGEDEKALAAWTHRVLVQGQDHVDAGTFQASPLRTTPHLDKFNRPYKSLPGVY